MRNNRFKGERQKGRQNCKHRSAKKTRQQGGKSTRKSSWVNARIAVFV